MTLEQWIHQQRIKLSPKEIGIEDIRSIVADKNNIENTIWGEAVFLRLFSKCPQCERELDLADLNAKCCQNCQSSLDALISSIRRNLEITSKTQAGQVSPLAQAGFDAGPQMNIQSQSADADKIASGYSSKSIEHGELSVDPSKYCVKCGRPYPEALRSQRICPLCKASEAKDKALGLLKKYT